MSSDLRVNRSFFERNSPECSHSVIQTQNGCSLRPKICLIDDDPIFTTVFKKYAESEGFAVDVYGLIVDIKTIERLRYDVIIMDYDLGGVSGEELAECFCHLGLDVPILMMSFSHREPELSEHWPEKVCGFVHKASGLREILHKAAKELNLAA